MSEVILVEYKAKVDGLTAELNTLKTSMKDVDSQAQKTGSTIEGSLNKSTTATKSLKAQLRELKAQLANATDPKDIERLARAAGELSDKLNDASESAKVFATGSKFEQIGNAFGSITTNLRNLDFQRANEQSKVLLGITKSITFKEAAVGIKDLGATLLNIGKSLLANPIFLIGSAVALIVSNFDKLKNSGGLIGKIFSGIGAIIDGVVNGLTKIADAIGLIDTKSTEQTDNLIKNFDRQLKATNDYYDRLIALTEAREKDATALRIKKANENIQNAKKLFDELEKIRKGYYRQATDEEKLAQHNMNAISFEAGRALTDDEKNKRAELLKIISENTLEIEVLVAKSETKTQKDREKASEKEKEDAKKRLEELKKFRDDYYKYEALQQANAIKNTAKRREDEIKAEQDQNSKLLDLKLMFNDNKLFEDETLKNLEYKLLEDVITGNDLAYKEDLKNYQDYLKNKTESAKKEAEERKAIEAATVAAITSQLQSLSTISQNETQRRINDEDERKNEALIKLDDELKKKQITEKEYQEKKEKLEQQASERKRKLQKEEFDRQKRISLIQAVISTAQGVANALTVQPAQLVPYYVALAAATGALQIAAISSQPEPKFEKGGKVKGKRHAQGGVKIEAEGDEWIIRRDEAIKHDRLLSAINSGKTDEYIYKHYIVPAIKKQMIKNEEKKSKDFASNIANSMMFNFKDENLLDSLKQSRKNDREIAIYLGSKIDKMQTNKRNW